MLEQARELMCSLYVEYGLCDASLKASELVDKLLNMECGSGTGRVDYGRKQI